MTTKSDLSHVRWIGGSPCAGKSTIATQLATTFDLNIYHCDDHWNDHVERAEDIADSLLGKLGNMTPEQLFLRPVDVQLRDEIAVYQEEFAYIVDDLLKFPSDKLLIAEGAALQPDLVVPHLEQSHHAIWIVPTADFQLREYAKREWMHAIAKQTNKPQLAIDRWMERDIRYALCVQERTQAQNQTLITVDGSLSLQQNYEIVKTHFRLSVPTN